MDISFEFIGKGGEWRLAPAYDVTWSYNPSGQWTSAHQMTILGKKDGFTRDDLLEFGNRENIKHASEIVEQIVAVVSRWHVYAEKAGVETDRTTLIGKTHRLFSGRGS